MSRNVKVVLDRGGFSSEVLKRAVKPVIDDVEEQVRGMADIDPAVEVYRNEDTDRSNVVATAPPAFEQAHGVLSQMLGKVVV